VIAIRVRIMPKTASGAPMRWKAYCEFGSEISSTSAEDAARRLILEKGWDKYPWVKGSMGAEWVFVQVTQKHTLSMQGS
jgi:hypothetical protein